MGRAVRSTIWRFSRPLKLTADVGVWMLCIPVAFVMRLETGPANWWQPALVLAVAALPTLLFVAHELGLARQSWAHVSLHDLRKIAFGTAAVTLVLFALASFLPSLLTVSIPRSVPLIAGTLAFGLTSGLRAACRFYFESTGHETPTGKDNTLIVGTDAPAIALAKELDRRRTQRIVGFLDSNPGRHGLSYAGHEVLGAPEDLRTVAVRHDVGRVFVATPLPPETHRRLQADAEALGLEHRIVPGLEDILVESPRQIKAILRSFVGSGRARNVLIIGGGGYIGSALVPRLLEQGLYVRVLDSFIYGKEPLDEVLGHERLEVMEGDFRNIDRIVEAMQGMDTVVHLGAIVGDPACALDEDLTVETNLMATKMVAEIAKGFGISRFVFASTCSVYGASDGMLDESSSLNPVSLYARTKIASERVLSNMAGDGFRPVILRFGTVYGFSGRTRFDLVVNLLTAKAVTDGLITLYGGDQWRPFIHVDDIAKAVQLSIKTPLADLEHLVYNVGADEQNHTLAQVADIIHARVPGSEVKDFGLDQDRRNYRVSFARIRKDMGFTPDWTMEAGVDQVRDAFRDGKVTSIKDPRYSNVLFLTEGGMSTIVSKVFGSVYDILEDPQNVDQAKASK